MRPHEQRVVEEKADLDDKIKKLTAFLLTETFAGLPVAEQKRMELQRRHMERYSNVLGERIAHFPP